MRLVQAGWVLFGVLAMAAGGTAARADLLQFPVHSIDAVAAGAMPEMTDISPTSSVLVFTSSVPLACSVVYGPTPAFGSVATDLDMDGGAHSDHRPVLAGLVPDQEYFYRVPTIKATSLARSPLPMQASLTDLTLIRRQADCAWMWWRAMAAMWGWWNSASSRGNPQGFNERIVP